MSRAASLFAVRELARKLAQPAAEFLHVIAVVKSSGLLVRELPLTGASPFGGLPDTTGDQWQESAQPADPAGRIDLLRRAAAARRHPESTQEEHDAKTAAAPVFSFRRSQHRAELAQLEARALPAAGVNAINAVNAGALAAETPAEFERRESVAAVPPPPMVPTPVSSSPAAIPHPRNMAGAAIELLDALATELLAAPATDRSPLHPAASAGRGAPTMNSRQDQPAASPRIAGHQPAMNPVHETLSLASLSTAYNGPQAVHPVMQAGEAPSLPGLPQVSTESASVFPSAASPNLDAETIASLVNEVLAEQARRHGVDLS